MVNKNGFLGIEVNPVSRDFLSTIWLFNSSPWKKNHHAI